MRKTMSKITRSSLTIITAFLMIFWVTTAQGGDKDKHEGDTASVSGTIMIDSSQTQSEETAQFLLDKARDNDKNAEYRLKFIQDTENFTPPEEGARVTVKGAVRDGDENELPVIMVTKVMERHQKESGSGTQG